jgi:hypothetical protein
MHPNQVGTVDLISYRTSRHDPIYKYPIEGPLTGTSISHVAMRITFSNKDLFDQYIAGNPNIPYDDQLIDPVTGTKMYEVYFSFWPATTTITIQTADSKLFGYEHDCEQSALGTPMSYTSRFNSYLHPISKIATPEIPVLGLLFGHRISLPPTSILIPFRLKAILQQTYPNASQSQIDTLNDRVNSKTIDYAVIYDNWFRALVEQENASKTLFPSANKISVLGMKTQAAYDTLLAGKLQLKKDIRDIIFAGQNISDETFMSELEKFMCFAQPEVDTVTLPVVHRSGTENICGLELEPMLNFIKNIADNPSKYQYNLFSLNCATILRNILAKSVENCINKKLRQAFDLPWYLQLLPVSPAELMKLANKSLNIEEMILTEQILTETDATHVKLDPLTTHHRRSRRACKLAPPAIKPILCMYENRVAANDGQLLPTNSFRMKRGDSIV